MIFRKSHRDYLHNYALHYRESAEAAAALFLDLGLKRKWPEIAAELNITPNQLKQFTKKDIVELNQVQGMQGEAMGRERLAEFLKEEGLAVDPVDLPLGYEEAMAQFVVEIVDVTPEDVEAPD